MTRSKFLGCLMLAAGFAVLFTGCYARAPGMVMPPPVTCTGSADTFSCTDDICPSGGGVYVQVPVHARCGAGGSCRPDLPGHDAAGCVGGTPPPTCPTSCDDGIACTRDFCASDLTCQHAPDNAYCGITWCEPSHPEAGTDGCIVPPDDPPPPPPTGFHCVWTASANRIGYAIRVRAADMTGVRTIPSSTGVTRPMSGSRIRLWALGSGAEVDSDASGWATYSLAGTPGGRINAHPYLDTWRFGTDPAFARDILNIADLQSLDAFSCADLGIQLEACPTPDLCVSGGWTAAPESFCQIDLDTRGATHWSDPEILASLRGDPVMRVVIATSGTNSAADCLPVP